MNHLKYYLSAVTFSLLVASTPHLSAESITANLFVDGSPVVLVNTNIGGVQQFLYSNTTTNILDTRTTDFTATYSNIAGIDVLSVTDVCAQVNILGGTPAPCQSVVFAFADVSHSDATIVSLLGTANGDVEGNLAAVVFGASVGSGSATVNYTGTGAATSTTPEPGSLALLVTGLCGVSGAVRRSRRVSA